MKTDALPRLRSRSLTLQLWLRRRARGEALYQLITGLAFLGIGIAMFAALLFLPVAYFWSSFDLSLGWSNVIILAGLFFLLLTVSFLVASRNQFGLVYPTRRKPENPQFASIDRFLLAAPTQLLTSFECFQKVVRLLRCDIPQVAVLLLWLFDRRRKASVEEICAGLSGDDSIRLLPQLHDLPGVIWLTYGHGVIILSLELRLQMARELNETFSPPRPEPAPEEEPAEDAPEPENSRDREMIAWYVALNLPPFAPLEKVKLRYRQLVKIYHPDAVNSRHPGSRGASEEKIKEINEAYHNILERSKMDTRSF